MRKVYTTSDFDYKLPEKLIAKYPLQQRSTSRLLVADRVSSQLRHSKFRDLLKFLNTNDLVIFNDTKVIPARLYGRKKSGGKVECLIEKLQEDNSVLAHLRVSKAPKIGNEIIFEDNVIARVLGREEDLFKLEFLTSDSVLEVLNRIGEIPVPPYLERSSEALDELRYQTVFAQKLGAVAAPTAALHFDQAMLNHLAKEGIETAMVTLHVGAGTFQPVRTEHLASHKMHKEYVEVSKEVCKKIEETRQRHGRIIAIGTTVVRCLETAGKTGKIKPYQGHTQLFITPGYQFRIVDVLMTNFHLPKSTLLMLVCAFGGYSFMMGAYKEAIVKQYRFFSYGDAMLII